METLMVEAINTLPLESLYELSELMNASFVVEDGKIANVLFK